MQKVASRLALATSCLLLAVGAVLAPAASAQLTETNEVLDGGERLVTTTLITDGGDVTVVTERLIAADGCSEEITTTTTTLVGGGEPVIPGGEYESRDNVVPLTPSTLVTDVTEQTIETPCDPPSATPPDEVLGEVILAVTGSDIDVPIAVGAALIGSGGLLVVASKRRRSRNTDQSS